MTQAKSIPSLALTATSLLFVASGCYTPPDSSSPSPNAIDKAKDVEDTLEERNQKQKEQQQKHEEE